MGLKLTTGQVAIGKDNFFEREEIIEEFWLQLELGNNILISAPRRIGKTSLIRYIEANLHDNYQAIYITTESISDENTFYKRIFDDLYEKFFKLQNAASKFKDSIANLVKEFELSYQDFTVKTSNLSDNQINYYNRLTNILENANFKFNLVIMIDEFAQTIQNIITNQSTEKAVQFLQNNRTIRQLLIHKKVQFVYAGSIGLENVAINIGCSTAINDLYIVEIKPLSRKEGERFIKELTADLKIKFTHENLQYILDKIEWLLPYFIQIGVDEVRKYCEFEEILTITDQIIDEAFQRILDGRKMYFEHWKDRLQTTFKNQDEVLLAIRILNYISNEQEVEFLEIKKFAKEVNLTDKLANILNTLEYDGYIIEKIHGEKNYRFLSPILKQWWCEHVSVFN